jgi:predicted GNAT family N-acyltransferase
MDEALKMVYDCVGILGGTIVWLEANKGADYVINFYNEYGFDELMSESQDDGIERLQLVKYLNKE